MSSGFDARRFFSYFFIVAIALVFILQFGPGSRGCNAPLRPSVTDVAARVNGKEVPLADFRRAYALRLEAFRQRGAGDLPESLARQLGIPGQILDQLIDVELLEQAADREGISVSDQELREVLTKDPSFWKDGAFDYATYTDILQNRLKKTAPEYESDLRRRIAAVRLVGLVGDAVELSDDELKARFLRDGDTVALSAVRFDPAAYASKIKQPSPAEVAAWEKSHAKEIAAYFEANKRDYSKGEQVRARHILVSVPRTATDADKAKAKEKVEALRKDIEGGKDFAEVAKASSDDKGSGARGGELGWAEASTFVPAFSQAAFALKIGELSQPVLTPFGWHLIQVQEKKPAEEKPLASVSGEIAAILLKRERARALAEADAKKAQAALVKGTSLATQFPDKKDADATKVASTDGPRAVDTGSFSKTATAVPRLGPAPALQAAAFAAEARGPLSGPFPSGDAFVVAEVTAREKADDATYAKKKDELRKAALEERREQARTSYVASLRKTANIVRNESLVSPAAAADEG